MSRIRSMFVVLLVVAALSQVGSLHAQEGPQETGDTGTKLYLPALTGAGDETASTANILVQLTPGSHEELEYFLAELDVLEASCGPNCVVALVSLEEYQRLLGEGRQVAIDSAGTAQLAVDLAQVQQAFSAGAQAINAIPGYSCYRTVEETYSTMAGLAAANPQLASWTDIGDSWEKVTPGGAAGYDTYVLKLTNSAITGTKPIFYLIAAIHAREYATAELATRFAEDLVAKYNVDPDVTWLLDYFEIHIVPQVNPDGRKKAETGLLWRKNTDNNDGCNTSSSWGTDLNRNSSFKWNMGGSSSNACNETYRGPSAASEPEVQAIQDYAGDIFLSDQRGPGDNDPAPADAQNVFITLHSYGQLVLYPWGWTTNAAPNSAQLQTLGRKFGYFNGHQVCNGPACLYGTSGTTDDFTYGEFGVASYTFEIGTAFFQSCSTFTGDILPKNLPALYYATKAARRPYQNPAGPDALNVAVSPATVAQGSPVTLNATLNDTRYNSNGWGAEPVQNITAGQYTIDAPSWAGGVPIAMSASDGAFNGTVENVTAGIDTAGLAAGRHILFVEGQDASGNWGVLSAAFLWVTSNEPTPTPTITPTPTETPTPTVTPTPTNTPVAGTTGFLSPSADAAQTSGAGDRNGFEVNPANAYADDSAFARDVNSGSNNKSSCTATSKDKHRFYNYNISLPGSVAVTGIEVRLDALVDAVGSNAPKMCVELSWDGGTTWTTAKQTSTLTTAEATYILGGAADTWGRAWTAANLSNTSFRVRVIDVASGSGANSRDFSLDWVAVRVSYQ